VLALDQPPECERGLSVLRTPDEGAQALLRNDGVMVGADHVLEVLCVCDDATRGLSHERFGELGRVPGALTLNPGAVEFLIRRRVAESLHPGPQLLELTPGDPLQRERLLRRRLDETRQAIE
jgi:hypothetical protein